MSKIIFEDFFNKSNGKPFFYKGKEIRMSDRIYLPAEKVSLMIEFISTDSEWKQGIVLQAKGEFEINGQKIPQKIVLWEHTSPKQLELIVEARDRVLFIYNVWDIGDSVMQYGHNGGALFLEHTSRATIYHCNDGYADDDFDDLIFRLSIRIAL